MNNLSLTPRLTAQETEACLGFFAHEGMAKVIVDQPTRVTCAESGRLLAVLVPKVITEDLAIPYYQALRGKISSTNNRSTSSGMSSKSHRPNRKRRETAVSVQSMVAGFMDRYPAMPYCRACAFNLKDPSRLESMLPALRAAGEAFARHAPERHQAQMEKIKVTAKDFCIPETPFTTLTINRNYRTAIHRDAGDLPEGFGVMSVLRYGSFGGALLTMPRYGVGFDCGHGDVLLFDPHEPHGNTEFKPFSRSYERISTVHYYRTGMANCGNHFEELARARSGKRTKK